MKDHEINKVHQVNERPSTESSVTTKRPQWFKELVQNRRSSENFTHQNLNKNHYIKVNGLETNQKESQSKKRKNHLEDFSGFSNQSVNNEKRQTKKTANKDSNKDFTFQKIDNFKPKDFIIPNLPKGKKLVFEIISNWGDEEYIGLNGIEIFQAKDDKNQIEKVQFKLKIKYCFNIIFNFRFGLSLLMMQTSKH